MTTMMLDGELTFAVARLDADLSTAAMTRELYVLRRRAVDAYEAALAYAGIPNAPEWRDLAQSVAAFLANVPAGTHSPSVAQAVARLSALVRENLA